MSRRIAVVTGTRADYSHLRWLIGDLASDPAVTLQVVATGTHLSERHGLTVREIEADGFDIAATVDIVLGRDAPAAVARSMGLAVMGFAEAFERLSPELVVVLGDRYEILAAAQAAMLLSVPIAHIHGGETTEGAMDEAIRHALTKMAHLHFVAAEPYAARVRQMGEDPKRVFMVGAPGLDSLDRMTLLDADALRQHLGLTLDARRPLLLVTYHPVTLSRRDPAEAAVELTAALDRFPEAEVVVTGVNADPKASAIDAVFARWVDENHARARLFTSLGFLRYLSLMTQAAAVVGNSSSGLIEAPAIGVPTVNIGERQAGRLRAASVIDCGEQRDQIVAALATALAAENRNRAATGTTPYGRSGASARIAALLRDLPLEGLLTKRFHDR